jgi:hydroxyacylglutathione hydrolase
MKRLGQDMSRAVMGFAGAIVVLSGCATQQTQMTLARGLTIHTFRREYANVHLVKQGSNSFLFDSGLAENAAKLAADIQAAGIDPRSLRAVIVSHGHADHAGGAKYFKEKFGVPTVAGAGDEPMLRSGRNERLCPTVETGRLKSDQEASYAPTVADVLVSESRSLEELTGIPGRILVLPGHTPGSLVINLGEAVLVGDLFRGAVLTSAAELHFYMCDVAGNRRDIQSLLKDSAPAASVFFPGHFGPVTRTAVVEKFSP